MTLVMKLPDITIVIKMNILWAMANAFERKEDRTMSGHETDHPELSERARGWLRYMYRKALGNDDWSKEGHPSEMWDGSTMPPLASGDRDAGQQHGQ